MDNLLIYKGFLAFFSMIFHTIQYDISYRNVDNDHTK